MYLFIFSIILVILGLMYVRNYSYEGLGISFLFIGVIILVIQLFYLTDRISIRNKMEQRETFKQTLKTARLSDEKLENSTVLLEIANWNMWTKQVQLDNKFWFDVYIPDEVDTMTNIQ